MNSESKKGIMGKLVQACRKRTDFWTCSRPCVYALRPWAMTHLGGEKVTIPLDQEETPVENETDTKDQEAQEKIQYPDLDCRRLSGDEPCIIPGGIVSRKKCG